jgi:UDP-N-acetylmuramate--alanine ligase
MSENNKNIEQFIDKLSKDSTDGLSVYFLGIGGIGMSALARYFKSRGIKVSGYDKTETALTRQLQSEGIEVHFEDDINLIDKNADFAVYTPAIPADHNELKYLLANGYAVLKRSEVLGLITRSSFNVCVAGTHGKTTTSTMIAHILRHSDTGCNAFLGGISSNYGTNFWSSEKNISVVEADEYDRSFLKLSPDVAVITAMDPDHLDIYETEQNFHDAFVEFSSKVKSGGLLISKYGLSNQFRAERKKTYSLDNELSDCYAKNIVNKNGAYYFDAVLDNHIISDIELNMGGLHNIENMIAAIAAVKQIGVSDEKIKNAVATFRGVKRRFEYIVNTGSLIMIDDYAHHPKELTALIEGTKNIFPEKKCTIVFQPHLYSRTRDFADGFAAALNLADEVFLLPIYPAREKPIEGVSSNLIASKMDTKKVRVCSKQELMDLMEIKYSNNEIEVLLTSGAGDIDAMIEPLSKILKGN